VKFVQAEENRCCVELRLCHLKPLFSSQQHEQFATWAVVHGNQGVRFPLYGKFLLGQEVALPFALVDTVLQGLEKFELPKFKARCSCAQAFVNERRGLLP